jgi:internalin A
VIDSLWIESDVKSLAGAECLTGLKSLTLNGLAAPDLAPLAELPALEELQLFKVARADLETLRRGSDLPSHTLRRLVVDGTELEQLAWLSGFETLQSLGLAHNGLQTLESLPVVPSLLTVALESNRVELGPLAKQPNLEGITASDCSMTDATTLNGAALHYLSLSRCPLSTFAGLELPELRDIYAYDVPLKAFGDLSGLPELANVEVMGSQLTSLEGLETVSKLGRLLVKGSPLSDVSALGGLTKLEFLDVHDSSLVDVSPLAAWSELDGTCRVLTLPPAALQAEVGASALDALCAAHFVIDDRCGEHCFGPL